MTRQNVTDGPREIMPRKCPTCGGDGIVYSDASAAIDVERRLRALAAGSRSQAFRVEVAAPIASALVGPGARRLVELESLTKRRFFLEGKDGMHLDHLVVLGEGKLTSLAPEAPVAEGSEVQVELREVDRHDGSAAVGKLDGFAVCVGEAAGLVGKKVKVRIERVLDGVAYATLVRRSSGRSVEPLTAEAEAEKPTRKPPARKSDEAAAEAEPPEPVVEAAAPEADAVEAEAVEAEGEETEDGGAEEPAAPAKKKTRRGSRGGRNRRKPAAGTPEAAEEELAAGGASEDAPEPPRVVTIHVPAEDFAREEAEPAEPAEAAEPAAEGAEEPGEDGAAKKKKTRRGTRGGRKRKKPAGASANGAEPDAEAEPEEPVEPEAVEPEAVEPDAVEAEPEPEPQEDGEWTYVPMSEWLDEIESGR
jgi:predicted RNA-binding protein with TRAM domain